MSILVWWGDRNGRVRTRPVTGPRPETDAMTVATRASSSSRGGRSPGAVLASSVLPEPGGPIMTMEWLPARASSRACLASSWPLISARSGPGSVPTPPTSPTSSGPLSAATLLASSTRGGLLRVLPRRLSRSNVAASASVAAADTSIESASLASARPSSGTTTRLTLRRERATTIGSRPGTGRSSPPSESSPRTAQGPFALTCSDPTRIPRAIARSSDAPLFRRSAGARLTVIRRGGYS